MVMRVQHIDGEYRVVLPVEAIEALHLSDGAAVEIVPVSGGTGTSGHRYATLQEGMDAFLRTEPLHENTYRELAK
jgi:bifunctional DNA-binding transcriptional regulator/antitoxin component of YhaV-PrlF toxin-antitoxin module